MMPQENLCVCVCVCVCVWVCVYERECFVWGEEAILWDKSCDYKKGEEEKEKETFFLFNLSHPVPHLSRRHLVWQEAAICLFVCCFIV